MVYTCISSHESFTHSIKSISVKGIDLIEWLTSRYLRAINKIAYFRMNKLTCFFVYAFGVFLIRPDLLGVVGVCCVFISGVYFKKLY
jgi:integral membrane sensor domain MASE1